MGGTGQVARAQDHPLTFAEPPVASSWWRPPAVGALICLLLAGCAGDERVRISQNRLIAAIQHGVAPAIVDVRTRGEYRKGHVPGAVHIPFYSLWWRDDQIAAAKDEPVVVYCAHGPRAGAAKFALWTLGYDQVVYLDGHMSAWKDRGLPMNTGPGP